MTDRQPPSHRVTFASTIAFLAAQALFSFVAVALVYFGLFSFDKCRGECDQGSGNAALVTIVAVSVISLGCTIAVVIWRLRHRQITWWVPLAGIATVAVVLVVALQLIRSGLNG